MAGYIIYSLDWNGFRRFVDNPSDLQLRRLVERVREQLHEHKAKFQERKPVHDWPSEPAGLQEALMGRLALPDWYGDLSDVGKTIFEFSFCDFCEAEEQLRFEEESEGVFWDLIGIVQAHHGVKPDHYAAAVVSEFGMRPYRYHPQPGTRLGADQWRPTHSMHEPREVQQLLEQLQAAAEAVARSGNSDAQEQYEEELMPAVERVAGEGRLLYVFWATPDGILH